MAGTTECTERPLGWDPDLRGERGISRHYAFSRCFEGGEQTFGRIDAAIYRNTKGGSPCAGNRRGAFADRYRPGRNPKDTGKAWVLRPTAKKLALRESDR